MLDDIGEPCVADLLYFTLYILGLESRDEHVIAVYGRAGCSCDKNRFRHQDFLIVTTHVWSTSSIS